MYAVTVTFEIMPEHADEIMPEHAEAFREAVVKQAENSVKKEEKCRQFDVCADPGRPDVVFLYEIYDDAAAFREHLSSDHFKIFDAAVKPWLTGKTVETWDIIASPR